MMLSLIAMGSFTACNDDELADKLNSKPVIIHATIANGSRVELGESADGKTKVVWAEGDSFVLTIGENKYTFDYKGDNDFEYDGENGEFPETFSAGTITAAYPTEEITSYAEQAGSKDKVGQYMYMTASVTVVDGEPTEGLNLTFNHNTSVIAITLINDAFANKEVSVALNATGLLVDDARSIKTTNLITANNNGKVEVYFAVPATEEELDDWNITVGCENSYYYTPLDKKAIVNGKLYKVDKSDLVLTHKTSTITKNFALETRELGHYEVYHYIGLYAWAKAVEAAPLTHPVNLTLEADINFPIDGITVTDGKPSASNWEPIKMNPYSGEVDGKNHTISGLRILKQDVGSGFGFFSSIGYNHVSNRNGGEYLIGTMKKLNIVDAVIYGHHEVGTLAGRISQSAVIEDCTVQATVGTPLRIDMDDCGKEAGGLFGEISGDYNNMYNPTRIKISRCSFEGSVIAEWYVGGIAGLMSGGATISDCTNKGDITATMDAGGIVGITRLSAYPRIERCENTGKIVATTENVGGIVGKAQNSIRVVACTNEGIVQGGVYVGGIAGFVQEESLTTSPTNSPLIATCLNLSDKVWGSDEMKVGGVAAWLNDDASFAIGSYSVKMSESDVPVGLQPARVAVKRYLSDDNCAGSYIYRDDLDKVDAVERMNAALSERHTAIVNYIKNESPVKDLSDSKKTDVIANGGCNYKWEWTGTHPEFSLNE